MIDYSKDWWKVKEERMTEDTKRALEIIKPIADELNIEVTADEKLMYLNGQAIGIGCNSTYATVMEFIGYVFATKYDDAFRYINLTNEQLYAIHRFWFTKSQLKKLMGDE